jgi:hypothetical protein
MINYIKQTPGETISYSDSQAIDHFLCNLKKNEITMFMPLTSARCIPSSPSNQTSLR